MKSHYIIEGDVVNLVGAKKRYSRLFYGTAEQAKNEVYAAAEADNHISETDGDCTIQLFERAGGRRYKPIGAEMTIR